MSRDSDRQIRMALAKFEAQRAGKACFVCGSAVDETAWPPTIAYVRMDDGPALPEHNDCRLHHAEGLKFPQGVEHEEERRRRYWIAAERRAAA